LICLFSSTVSETKPAPTFLSVLEVEVVSWWSAWR